MAGALVACACQPGKRAGTEADGAAPTTLDDAAGAAPPMTDAAAVPPAIPPTAQPAQPPLPLTDLALWLDGDAGPVSDGTEVIGWRDRSGRGHDFVVESSTRARPMRTQLNEKNAVAFDGHQRLLVDPADPTAEKSLAIGTKDFVLAVVLVADRGPTEQELAFGFMPRVSRDFVDPVEKLLLASLNRDLVVSFGAQGPSNRFEVSRGGPFDDGRPRLIVLAGLGSTFAIRINGVAELEASYGRLAGNRKGGAPVDLGHIPLYLGNWDFDFQGLKGAIAEVVLVLGGGAQAAVEPLEQYLRGKYRL
jgi:hypothetical protein